MEKISSSFELISHPDRTLAEHLQGCDEASQLQLSFKYINCEKFFPFELLEKMRKLLVYFHDFGKGTDYFASKIVEAIDYKLKESDSGQSGWQSVQVFAKRMQPYLEDFKNNKRADADRARARNPRLADHAKLGAYYVLGSFSSDDSILPFILLKIILKHHGNLSNFWRDKNNNPQIYLEDDQIELLEKQLEKLDFNLYQKILSDQGLHVRPNDWKKIKDVITNNDSLTDVEIAYEDRRDIRYFFLQHFLFSLLLSADKGDVKLNKYVPKHEFIRNNEILPLWLIDSFKSKVLGNASGSTLDNQREEAYNVISKNCTENSAQNFFSITLPTGLGKTFAAYNAAVILQNAYVQQTGGKKPRIIYCLPFTSIIDQNAAILEHILTFGNIIEPKIKVEWLAKNHYLSSANQKYYERELEDQEPEYLTDGWEHEVIVTTFVQMLESIFTNRNTTLRKFHNMTNAIFVLDEVQNVPPKYYEAIERVFRAMATYFNTKFVFVTATQPYLFKEKESIFELTQGKTERYFRQLNRIKLDQQLLRSNGYEKMDINYFFNILTEDINNNPGKSFLIICNTLAQSLWLFNALEASFPESSLIYLSSSLLPPVRRWNIRRIKNSKKRKIVISTQVVEAGVDIDLDVVYRDFAPIDSINQSAGRCNRNALRGRGVVKLFNLGKHRRIYDPVLIGITQEVLASFGDEIMESQLFDLNNAYAAAVRRKITDDNNVSQKLIRAMETLQLETIEASFRLIEEDHRHYNVFLPCSLAAKKAWTDYCAIQEISDPYKRKTKMKQHQPLLLQYVTRFPKNKYTPEDAESFLVYEPNWQNWYDLDKGFRLDNKEDTSLII
jgi:CRISPR-associated endonuclease/helicase Cas3